MSWQSAPAIRMSRSTSQVRHQRAHLVGDAHREAGDAADVIGLAAAPERVDAGIARRLDLADRTEAAGRKRQRPGLDHLGAQLRIADLLDLRQLGAHPRAQLIGDGAWIEHGCLPATFTGQLARAAPAVHPFPATRSLANRLAGDGPRRLRAASRPPERFRSLGEDVGAGQTDVAQHVVVQRLQLLPIARPLLPDQEEIDRALHGCAQDERRRARRLAPWRRAARAVVSWIVDISWAPEALPVMAFQEPST